MESRWYLKRGQTLENTKIEDRGHALHVSRTAWEGIQKHLDRKKLIAEALDHEQDYRKRMKEGSDNMTKNWENSVENIRKRAEAERQNRCEAKEDTKMKNYEALRKQQDVIRQKYVEQKQMEAYMSTQYPKEINGALLMGEVLHQREKQIEFQKFMKQREKESEDASALKIKQAAEEERLENEAKQREFRKKQETYAAAAKHEMLKKIKSREDEKRAQIEFDAVNNIRAAEEIAEYERMNHAAKVKHMKQARAEVVESLEMARRRKEHFKKQEDEVDEVIKIFSDAKERIYCLRKIRDKELQDESVEKRIKAAAGAIAEQKVRDAGIDQMIAAYKAEKDKEEAEKEAAKQQKLAMQRAEREEDYKSSLIEQQKRQEVADQERNWELLNRFKTVEVMADYEQKQRRDAAERKVAYRKELDEMRAAEAAFNASDDLFSANVGKEQLKNIEAQDRMFFKYADEVLNLAKSRGRQTMPIEKVIAKYKKEAFGESVAAGECEEYRQVRDEESLLRRTPGMRQHDPKSDPVYNRCKCQRERLYR